jgi:hypothetical protein
MSIDHKAYLFRHDEFQAELAVPLRRALQTGKVHALRDFINRHRASLTDLGMGAPLAEDWEEAAAEPDVQHYADLALTRYYDLTDSQGLSYGFDALSAYLHTVPRLARYADDLICGRLFGPRGKRLDPGRMGTGLLSPAQAGRFARLLAGTKWPAIPGPEAEIYADCHYQPESPEDVQKSLDQLLELYGRAAKARVGILFADFNDCGVSHL